MRRSKTAELREIFLQRRRQQRRPESNVQREHRRNRYFQRYDAHRLELGSSSNVGINERNFNVPPVQENVQRLRLTAVRRTARSLSNLPTERTENIPSSTRRLTDVRRLARTISVLPTSVSETRSTYSRRHPYKCGRNFVPDHSFQKLMLPELSICLHCGAKLLKYETMEICCRCGTVDLNLSIAPQGLVDLFSSQSEEGEHFRQNIRSYNHAFSFTSMGVNIDERFTSGRNGIFSHRAQGTIYHRIGSILPIDGRRPRLLQMYIYDTEHEIENRHVENTNLRVDILRRLRDILNHVHNPYVTILRHLGQRDDIHDCRLIIKELTVDRRTHELPTVSQVAAVLVGADNPEELGERDIIVQTQGGDIRNIPDTDGYYDPLQYPLLLPYGQYGCDLAVHGTGTQRISCRCYYSYILQMRPTRLSLLLLGGCLLQQYVVDLFVKIETMRLRYFRTHQADIRAELYQGLQDAVFVGETRAENVGRRIILPSSHTGSRRDMHRRYQDAMALVRRFWKMISMFDLIQDYQFIIKDYMN